MSPELRSAKGAEIAQLDCLDRIAKRCTRAIIGYGATATVEGLVTAYAGYIANTMAFTLAGWIARGIVGIGAVKTAYDLTQIGNIMAASVDASKEYCDCQHVSRGYL